jgi:hypothetical protein
MSPEAGDDAEPVTLATADAIVWRASRGDD